MYTIARLETEKRKFRGKNQITTVANLYWTGRGFSTQEKALCLPSIESVQQEIRVNGLARMNVVAVRI